MRCPEWYSPFHSILGHLNKKLKDWPFDISWDCVIPVYIWVLFGTPKMKIACRVIMLVSCNYSPYCRAWHDIWSILKSRCGVWQHCQSSATHTKLAKHCNTKSKTLQHASKSTKIIEHMECFIMFFTEPWGLWFQNVFLLVKVQHM